MNQELALRKFGLAIITQAFQDAMRPIGTKPKRQSGMTEQEIRRLEDKMGIWRGNWKDKFNAQAFLSRKSLLLSIYCDCANIDVNTVLKEAQHLKQNNWTITRGTNEDGTIKYSNKGRAALVELTF